MYELIQVSEKSFYIESPARIGLVRLDDQNVCLIDSGSDKDAGKKVRRLLETQGWELKAVYNTHSHADHIGGSRYLQSQTGCSVFAPGIECSFTRHTVLEPAFLYGGYPCRDLRHKFLMAQECDVQPLTEDQLPQGFEMIPLPGHSFDMTGFRTSDDVIYLADCLSSRETLDKYRIGFLYDVEAYLDTLEKVKTMSAAMFVPAHAEPAEDIAPLAQYNIDRVHETAEKIVDICREPVCFEQILQRLFTEYDLSMNFEQHVLVGSTIRSYLSWMKDTGRLQISFQDNLLLWEQA